MFMKEFTFEVIDIALRRHLRSSNSFQLWSPCFYFFIDIYLVILIIHSSELFLIEAADIVVVYVELLCGFLHV